MHLLPGRGVGAGMVRAMFLGLAALLSACSGRPEWADGRLVTEAWPADAAPQDLSTLRTSALALHNRARAEEGLPPLAWDDALAAAAARYAQELTAVGRLRHSEPQDRPGQGENLWMGTRGAYTVEEMIGSWTAERRLFEPGTFPDVSRSGHWSDVGHYTQIIWPGTTRLGCAVRSSDERDYLVCRYAPAGNVVGQPVG